MLSQRAIEMQNGKIFMYSCEVCGKQGECRRTTRRFCSPKCWYKRRGQQRKAAGLCSRCGGQKNGNLESCRPCANSARSRAYPVHKVRYDAGLCTTCGLVSSDAGWNTCAMCRDKKNNRTSLVRADRKIDKEDTMRFQGGLVASTEVQQWCGIHRGTLDRWVQQGHVTVVRRLNKQRWFKAKEVAEFTGLEIPGWLS